MFNLAPKTSTFIHWLCLNDFIFFIICKFNWWQPANTYHMRERVMPNFSHRAFKLRTVLTLDSGALSLSPPEQICTSVAVEGLLGYWLVSVFAPVARLVHSDKTQLANQYFISNWIIIVEANIADNIVVISVLLDSDMFIGVWRVHYQPSSRFRPVHSCGSRAGARLALGAVPPLTRHSEKPKTLVMAYLKVTPIAHHQARLVIVPDHLAADASTCKFLRLLHFLDWNWSNLFCDFVSLQGSDLEFTQRTTVRLLAPTEYTSVAKFVGACAWPRFMFYAWEANWACILVFLQRLPHLKWRRWL